MAESNDRMGGALRGFMTRLARDVRANTMAIMAIAIIPLAGLVGGGIDISRMYIVKTRLQHACDAGALAGRKAMGGGTWGGTSGTPNTTALQFFDSNYSEKAYGVTSRTRTFTESGGRVSGTATAVVPMTLMRIFGKTSETMNVTCEADMRLPNTDVMFVLDTTGSMGDTPSGDTMSKLASLKIAVKCFYEIVARRDIADTTCASAPSTTGVGNDTQVRFGFVPYATNVNVGKLLPPDYFANSWDYQTRKIKTITHNWTNNAWTSSTVFNPTSSTTTVDATTVNIGRSASNSRCQNNIPSSSTTTSGSSTTSPTTTTEANNVKTQTYTVTTSGTQTTYTYTNGHYSGNNCSYNKVVSPGTQVVTYTKTDTDNPTIVWTYGSLPVDVTPLKNGTAWADTTSFTLPIANKGLPKTITWDGCVEERRPTAKASSYWPIPAAAKDLDIDLLPSQGDATTLWGPLLNGIIFTRKDSSGNYSYNSVDSSTDYGNDSSYACATEARKLTTWDTPSTFQSYVNGLASNGNTYHDIGLIWGGRLMSPTGIFAAENALTPKGGEIQRHMIFMTDGDPCTSTFNYQAYGVAWFDRRQTDSGTAPTDGCTDTGTLTTQVNARMAAVCTAIKNKNITLWVIAFGSLATTTETRLKACSSGATQYYFKATDSASIQSAFAKIANQISALRLTS